MSNTLKSEFKLFAKLVLAFLIIIILTLFSVILLNFFPEHFTTGIYGCLVAQKDYAEKDHTDNRILIIGDSIAQVSYYPELLSNDTYNYGIGNETPVDGYYRLLDYLENHPKPDYIFCSYNFSEFISQKGFWSTTMYERGIPFDMAYNIVQDASNYGNSPDFSKDNMMLQAIAYYCGFHIESIKMVLKGMAKNLTDETCYENYCYKYEWVTDHRGQWKHYMGGTGSDVNDTVQGEFSVTEIADSYIRKMINLCEENDITLIMETVPINSSSYAKLNPQFSESYETYWDTLAGEYPNLIVNSQISCYDDRLFGDAIHFNEDGTVRFSQSIHEKYKDIFDTGWT